MVPVPRIDYRLVGMPIAGKAAEDVVRHDRLRLHRFMSRQGAVERHRLEVTQLCRFLQRFEIEACCETQLHGHVAMNAYFHGGMLRSRILPNDVLHSVSSGVFDLGTAMRGGGNFVSKETKEHE